MVRTKVTTLALVLGAVGGLSKAAAAERIAPDAEVDRLGGRLAGARSKTQARVESGALNEVWGDAQIERGSSGPASTRSASRSRRRLVRTGRPYGG
jgi:hypothetical protein